MTLTHDILADHMAKEPRKRSTALTKALNAACQLCLDQFQDNDDETEVLDLTRCTAKHRVRFMWADPLEPELVKLTCRLCDRCRYAATHTINY